MLEGAGLLRESIVGKTCVFGGERGIEINSWLKAVPYPVESFVILDDKGDMAMHRDRLVQVDSRTGLGAKEVRRNDSVGEKLTLTAALSPRRWRSVGSLQAYSPFGEVVRAAASAAAREQCLVEAASALSPTCIVPAK